MHTISSELWRSRLFSWVYLISVYLTCKFSTTTGRVARDTFTVSTDDAIQQFTDAFVDLKTRLRERMDLQSWKIACTMKDGVLELSEYAKRLKDIGELPFV